LTVISHFH